MSEYIFRFPADTPELTYETLRSRIDALCPNPACHMCELKIGTTVTVRRHGTGVSLTLYSTEIARIYPESVDFPGPDHPSQATTAWLARIIQDNGIDSGCWRVRRRKADGLGPWTARGRAGLLVLASSAFDQRREVFGRMYPVDHEAVAKRRERNRRWHEYRAGRMTWDEAFAS